MIQINLIVNITVDKHNAVFNKEQYPSKNVKPKELVN